MKSFQFLLPNKQNYIVWLSAINLLIGVFVWKWRTEAIIFAFLWETAVLGILHVFKLYGTLIWGQTQRRTFKTSSEIYGLGFQIFMFVFVYFLFFSAHLLFAFVFMMPTHKFIDNPFLFYTNTRYFLDFQDMRQAWISSACITVIGSISTFFVPGKIHNYTVEQLIIPAYTRIAIQQLVTILGGFLFLQTGGLLGVAVVIILIRFVMDNAFIEARKNQTFRVRMGSILFKKAPTDSEESHQKSLDALFDA